MTEKEIREEMRIIDDQIDKLLPNGRAFKKHEAAARLHRIRELQDSLTELRLELLAAGLEE